MSATCSLCWSVIMRTFFATFTMIDWALTATNTAVIILGIAVIVHGLRIAQTETR